MKKKHSSSDRELLNRLYDASNHDFDEDSYDDEPYYDEVRRHPEAPLNDSIAFEKRGRRRRASSLNDRANRELEIEKHLDYIEYLAMKRASQRNDRHWTHCRPALLGCALTCIVTAGIIKGPELAPQISSLLTPAQPAFNQPIRTPLMTSAPMVVDTTNSMERIPGLTAAKSTITGFADSSTMTGAYYWTLQVSNSGQQNQEARMRIALPAGVTLSRATLWVNGIPQEASFSTTEQVTAAYNWVRDGREQHRFLSHDPLVITQESPGHLLVKAAPITPGGHPLQLRLGFTAPLRPSSTETASMRLPQIQESNFEVTGQQDVHLQSSTSIWSNQSEVTAIPDESGFLLKGNIKENNLSTLTVNVARNKNEQFATRATHSPKGTYIVATMKPDDAGHMNLSLLKTTKKPNCKIIDSEPAAVRLTTLWAYGQVEASVKRGDRFTANELARIFRVVSSVSGATVLERDSDYTMNGLSRDQFATYSRRGAASGGSGGGGQMFDSVGNAPSFYERIAPQAPSAPSPKSSMGESQSVAEPIVQSDKVKAFDSNDSSTSFDEVIISEPSESSETSIKANAPEPSQSSRAQTKVEESAQLLLPFAIFGAMCLLIAKFGKGLLQKLVAYFKK